MEKNLCVNVLDVSNIYVLISLVISVRMICLLLLIYSFLNNLPNRTHVFSLQHYMVSDVGFRMKDQESRIRWRASIHQQNLTSLNRRRGQNGENGGIVSTLRQNWTRNQKQSKSPVYSIPWASNPRLCFKLSRLVQTKAKKT